MAVFAALPLRIPLSVSSLFGAKEPGLRSAPHSGVDLRAPEGTQLFSPGAGVVTLADDDEIEGEDAGGLELVIQLDNGHRVGFAHLLVVVVRVGDRVEQGELVGATGATGHVTGPHLHLTLRRPDGTRIDPLPHLQAIKSSMAGRVAFFTLLGFGLRALLRGRR